MASSPGGREVLQFFTILSFLFIFLFQFTDVDISQSTLDIWFHMLICIVITHCVYNSFGTKLHATTLIDTALKFLEIAHRSAVSKSHNYMYFSMKLKKIINKIATFISRHQCQA